MTDMSSPPRPESRLSEDFHWSPRQRQVLELIARGHTNAQIADELGVTLNGAKWHVSEIISKLGVDTREEAADYWRAYNGLPTRLARLFHTLAAAGTVRWIAAAGAAGVVVGAAALVLALGSDDDESGTAPDATPTDTATAQEPTATTTLAPEISPTPLPGDTRLLTLGAAFELEEGMAAYLSTGCYYCGRPAVPNLERIWRNAQGELERRDLFPFLADYPQGYPRQFAADWQRGIFYVDVCVQGYCGGEAEPSDDAESELLYSNDGGVTWAHTGNIRLEEGLGGVVNGEVLVRTVQVDGDSWSFSYRLHPSGTPVEPPGGDRSLVATVAPGVGVLSRAQAPTSDYLASDGSTALSVPGNLGWDSYITRLDDGRAVVQWYSTDYSTPFFGLFGADGELQASWSWQTLAQQQMTDITGILSPNVAYGSAQLEDFFQFDASAPFVRDRMVPIEAVIVRLDTNTLHPIAGMSEGLTGNMNPFLEYLEAGPHVRVNSGDQCLNVRTEPSLSAPVIRCLADGVLLRSGETREAGGITWQQVTTPDGRPGWASTEFLAR